MASAAGQGTTTNPYEGGGAGGKFRKRPFRRTQTTPYDRPPIALRNPGSTRGGWLSKLVVDPASKLISASAHYFLSSLFRKSLPPPPPEENQGSSDRRREAVSINCAATQKSEVGAGGNPTDSSEGSGLSELERILKQKTFTRSEIDRLTNLLRSRTDSAAVDEEQRNEANISQPASNFNRHKEFSGTPMEENMTPGDKSRHTISTPFASSRIIEDNIASPAEVAKAYMVSRPSKVSPSMLGPSGQALREDPVLLTDTPFHPKSSSMSLASKSAFPVAISENGFRTPRSLGRSAIYNMARTPYSRVHQTSIKGTGSRGFGYGGPPVTSSTNALEYGVQLGSKQVSQKRRSSALDGDVRSVGVTRRIRQKPNLLSQESVPSTSIIRLGSDPVSSSQRLVIETTMGTENGRIPGTSAAHTPTKASEVATKILQELEKLTPRQKSLESKLLAIREKSPTKLMPNMLSGQALRSLEDVDSSKSLQNAQDLHKGDVHNAYLTNYQDRTSQKQDKVGENGSKPVDVPRDRATSFSDTSSGVRNVDSSFPNSSILRENKRAFKMSAHEDFLELDDDVYPEELVSASLAKGIGRVEASMVETNPVSTEAAIPDNAPSLPEVQTPSSPVLNKHTDVGASNGCLVVEKTTGFTSHASNAPSAIFQPVKVPQSFLGFDKTAPFKEPNAPHLVNHISKQPFASSSSISVNESLGANSGARSDPKSGSSQRLDVARSAAGGHLKISKPEKTDESTQMAAVINGKSETSISFVSTSPPTSSSSLVSFNPFIDNAGLNNGSNPVVSSTNTATVTTIGTTAPTLTAKNSNLSASTTIAPLPSTPIFKFGSSVAPSSAPETTDLKDKNEKEPSSGLRSSHTSLAMPGTDSSIIGFSSSAAASTAQNQSHAILSGADTGSKVSTLASPAAGFGVVSTTSSPVFSNSWNSSSTSSSSSLIGSSNSASKLFGSNSGFGLSSSAPSSVTNANISSSGANSGFGLGSSAPSSGANATTISGTGANSGFSLGSSAPSSGTNTTTISGSGASTSMFSFGLSGSTSSTQTSVFGSSNGLGSSKFSFGLSSSASSSQVNPVTFGSQWQATNSPVFDSTFTSTSSPSTGFAFGVSSLSSAAANHQPTQMTFGSSTSAQSSSIFSLTSPATPSFSQTKPIFGGNSSTAFTAASANSGDQMNMEDSMAEDPVQASTPFAPVFGQPSTPTPAVGCTFASASPSLAAPFQFGTEQPQNQASTPQNPFQPSGFNGGGGSFSLGSVGNDKSNRKIVKVNRNKNRRK